MLDLAAAEDADLDLGVEQREVDGDLGGGQRGVVLGVEVPRVAQLEHAGAALAAQVRGAEVGDAGGAEVVEARERLRGRLQHRPDEVGARLRVGEHGGQQLALPELQPVLVGEHALALRGQLGLARARPREELLDPQRPVAGQLEIEGGGVRHAAPTRSGVSALRVKRLPSWGSSSGVNARRSNSS